MVSSTGQGTGSLGIQNINSKQISNPEVAETTILFGGESAGGFATRSGPNSLSIVSQSKLIPRNTAEGIERAARRWEREFLTSSTHSKELAVGDTLIYFVTPLRINTKPLDIRLYH